jgi:hypothetical protein
MSKNYTFRINFLKIKIKNKEEKKNMLDEDSLWKNKICALCVCVLLL